MTARAAYLTLIGLALFIIVRAFLFLTMAAYLLDMAPANISGPESLIGRNVAAFFDPPGAFFAGRVISFEHPHVDDSIDAAAEGTWFKVRFEDQHVQDYNITELKNILIPVGKEYGQLSSYEWSKAKMSFDCIGLALREGTANPNTGTGFARAKTGHGLRLLRGSVAHGRDEERAAPCRHHREHRLFHPH